MANTSTALAQGEDMVEAKKAKVMVDEMKKEEREMRAEAEKHLNETRQRAIEELEKVLKDYQSPSKKKEADRITKEIIKLKKKIGGRVMVKDKDKDEAKPPAATSNQYFKFKENYFFDEKGIIRGKFIFSSDQKVKATYSYKGQQLSKVWGWKDMGDHIQINADETLGTIIISEQPNSNLKGILIRWGGDLTHKLTEAKSD